MACVPVVDLVWLTDLLENMAKILEEVAKELKLVKVGTSRYWWT